MPDSFQAVHFPLRIDRQLGQVKKERDYERYIVQLMKQVLLTAPGERAHRPDFGAGLRRMVFSPTDSATASLLKTTIYQNLTRWLDTLITVDEIETESDNSTLRVTIHYTVKSRGTSEVLNIEVTS